MRPIRRLALAVTAAVLAVTASPKPAAARTINWCFVSYEVCLAIYSPQTIVYECLADYSKCINQ